LRRHLIVGLSLFLLVPPNKSPTTSRYNFPPGSVWFAENRRRRPSSPKRIFPPLFLSLLCFGCTSMSPLLFGPPDCAFLLSVCPILFVGRLHNRLSSLAFQPFSPFPPASIRHTLSFLGLWMQIRPVVDSRNRIPYPSLSSSSCCNFSTTRVSPPPFNPILKPSLP